MILENIKIISKQKSPNKLNLLGLFTFRTLCVGNILFSTFYKLTISFI
jgi:hypothetical protein